jgi:hypothetical protein
MVPRDGSDRARDDRRATAAWQVTTSNRGTSFGHLRERSGDRATRRPHRHRLRQRRPDRAGGMRPSPRRSTAVIRPAMGRERRHNTSISPQWCSRLHPARRPNSWRRPNWGDRQPAPATLSSPERWWARNRVNPSAPGPGGAASTGPTRWWGSRVGVSVSCGGLDMPGECRLAGASADDAESWCGWTGRLHRAEPFMTF